MKFILLSLTILAVSPAAFAVNKADVFTSACDSSMSSEKASENLFATAVQFNGRNYLVTKASELTSTSGVCFFLAADKTPLKLIMNDHRMGLALLESPFAQGARLDESQYLRVDKVQTSVGEAQVVLRQSSRHYFPQEADVFEIYIPQAAGRSAINTAGSAVTAVGGGFSGILSNETLLLLPGQPAKTYREHDLVLLEQLPGTLYRLVLSPPAIRQWIAKVLSGTYTGLQIVDSSVSADGGQHTRWLSGKAEIAEDCFKTSARLGSGQFPIGGVQPVGIGGLENVLSDCRLSIENNLQPVRIFLGYQKNDDGYRIQSLMNVNSYLQILDQPGWKILTDETPVADASLADLRSAAAAARDAAVAFYQKHLGNPLVLRKVFLETSLLVTSSWNTVTASDLGKLRDEVEFNLPISLADSGIRVRAEDSKFASLKQDILQKLQALKTLREKKP